MNNLNISNPVRIAALIAIGALISWGAWYAGKNAAKPPLSSSIVSTPPPKQWIVCGSGQCAETDSIQVQGQCAMTAEQAVFCTSWSALKNPNKK